MFSGVRGLCAYSLEVAGVNRSWHTSRNVILSSQIIPNACSGSKPYGWVTKGPGQHHGHCPAPSPALRVSYTTVYVPAYRSFHDSVKLCEKLSSQPSSSDTHREIVASVSNSSPQGRLSPENERNSSSAKVKEKETLKPSSQVEVTVKDLKEKAKAAGSPIDKKTVVERKSLGVRIKEEILHYYHGFRLLFIDTNICCKYIWRIVNGETLSRREHRQVQYYPFPISTSRMLTKYFVQRYTEYIRSQCLQEAG